LIEKGEYEELKKSIDRKIVALENKTFDYEMPSFNQFLL